MKLEVDNEKILARIEEIHERPKWLFSHSNFEAATRGAVYLARKTKMPLVIVPTRREGKDLFRVVTPSDDIGRFVPIQDPVLSVALAREDGLVLRAIANEAPPQTDEACLFR